MNLFKQMAPTLLIDGKNTENRISAIKSIENLNSEGEIIRKRDLKLLEIGLYGENQILFELLHSNIPMYIFHDVYYEFEDKTAQIDFIVVTEYKVFIIECKNVIGNVIINNDASFIREYSNIKEGMYSPLTQNQRHIDLLVSLVISKQSIINKLLNNNSKVNSFFDSVVVFTNPKTIIKNKYAPKNIKDKVIRADNIISYIKSVINRSKNKVIDIESFARLFEFYNTSIENDFISKYDKYLTNNKETGNSLNIELLKNKLIEYRLNKSKEEGNKAYFIFNNEQLENIINELPRNLEQLLKINGFGKYKIEKYGNDIINIINEYYM